MIGVVIPVRNEEALLGGCLASVLRAAADPLLAGEEVCVVTVLDDCTDRSEGIAVAYGATVVKTDAALVGHARALGARRVLAAGARWIGCTDADSIVAPDWLSAQLALGADAVCGTVTVDDWKTQAASVRRRYHASYVNADGHRHVHGANLGFSADAYVRAGGFLPLAYDEDVALVSALIASGVKIAWSAVPRVRTSARANSRAPRGFGHYLRTLAVTS